MFLFFLGRERRAPGCRRQLHHSSRAGRATCPRFIGTCSGAALRRAKSGEGLSKELSSGSALASGRPPGAAACTRGAKSVGSARRAAQLPLGQQGLGGAPGWQVLALVCKGASHLPSKDAHCTVQAGLKQ